MYPRNCWYVVADKEDVTSSEIFPTQVAGTRLVLYRDENSKVVAMADKCCHRLAPLSLGRIEGSDTRCMYHGIKFSSEGKCLEVPGSRTAPNTFCVKTYAVVERFEWIWAWIGDEPADESLIPDIKGQNPEKCMMKKGALNFKADYQLVNDNLCDFSHVAYVHESTFGKNFTGPRKDEWAHTMPDIECLPNGVRVTRILKGVPGKVPGGPEELDMVLTYDYLLPSILLMYTGFFPCDTVEKYAVGQPPPVKPLLEAYNEQAITAADESNLRYFFSTALPCGTPQEMLDFNYNMTEAAFVEDRKMIEGQYRVIQANPTDGLNATPHDKAALYFRKLVAEASRPPEPESPTTRSRSELSQLKRPTINA